MFNKAMANYELGSYDTYVLLPNRSAATVAHVEEHFGLDDCRACAEDYIVAEDSPTGPLIMESWPEVRSYLLDHDDEAQMVTWSCDDPRRLVTVEFTDDGHLVVGVSVEGVARLEAAKTMLQLVEEFDAVMGLVAWEEAPPISRSEFEKRVEGLTFASFRSDI